MRKRATKAAAVTAGALLFGLVATPPAHAEGHKTTKIVGWSQGDESKRWDDKNLDSAKTKVKLSGCGTDTYFKSATLTLYRNREWRPDVKIGSIRHKCGTYTWGDLPSGDYYFVLSGFLGGGRFYARKVVISW